MSLYLHCEDQLVNTSPDSTVAASNPGLDLGLLSSDYVEELYNLYQSDTDRVPAEWQSYFRSLQSGPNGMSQPASAMAPAERPRTVNRLVGEDGSALAMPAKAPTLQPEEPGIIVLGTSAPSSRGRFRRSGQRLGRARIRDAR